MRKITLITTLTLVLVIAVLLCAGCTGTNNESKSELQNYSDDYTPVTVENYGRTFTITEKPKAVVVAGPNCAEVFIALGLVDYVVGKSCDNHCLKPLPEYAEEYYNIPETTHGYPTIEAVVSSGCDFLYAIDWVFEGDFTVETLEDYGINVYVCEATDYEGVWKEIRDIGEIFEAQDAAEAFIASEKARLAAVEEAVAGQETKKVFIYDSDTGNGVYTAGGPNIETQFIESAGGTNIFKDLDQAWVGVSYEEILERNPDYIIIHDYEEATYDENINSLVNDPILSQLDAVKNKHFIRLSLESAFPGSRTAYSVEKIAEGMFPEQFEAETT